MRWLDRSLLLAGLLCAFPVCYATEGPGITGDLGAGFSYGPHDPTGVHYQTQPIPYVDLAWGPVNLSADGGLSWDAFKTNDWSIGPFVNYVEGRNASGKLRGLHDVPDMAEVGGFVEYSPVEYWRVFAELGRAYGGRSRQGGVMGRVGTEVDYPLGMGIYGGTTVTGHFSDGRQAQTFFGVDAAESRHSGLDQYNASGGLQNMSLNQSFRFPLGGNWALLTSATWTRLVNSAEESPIVTDRGNSDQFQADVAIAYHF